MKVVDGSLYRMHESYIAAGFCKLLFSEQWEVAAKNLLFESRTFLFFSRCRSKEFDVAALFGLHIELMETKLHEDIYCCLGMTSFWPCGSAMTGYSTQTLEQQSCKQNRPHLTVIQLCVLKRML